MDATSGTSSPSSPRRPYVSASATPEQPDSISLTGYVRATSLVALVDAAGIGTGLAIMGIPLASLVFLGAFIPLVGAVLSGFFAVVVALLAKGFVYALITLGVVIAVMQLEAHVLQPLVMGRAVSIHPLAVVLGISAGGVIAGIVGALLAVRQSMVRIAAAATPPTPTSSTNPKADHGAAHGDYRRYRHPVASRLRCRSRIVGLAPFA